MSSGRRRAAFGPALTLLLLPGLTAAELKTVGRGKEITLVREQFPPEYQARFDLFAKRCTRCHEMARPIVALQTGVTPISGGSFEAEGIKMYVIKMMQKLNSGLDREDAREIIPLLTYAREQAKAR